MPLKSYFTYIVTNYNKTVLYTGITGNLKSRIKQHYNGELKGFSSKYNCKYLLYYEKFDDVNLAISREKQIKKWNRKKKEELIFQMNPDWNFLNETVNKVDEQYL